LIEAQYEEIKNSPDIIKIKTEILRSEEIVVPLTENINNQNTEKS